MADLDIEDTNIAVYIVDTSPDSSDLPRICKAFFHLFEVYASLLRSKRNQNPSDVILHVLPIATLATKGMLVVPSLATFRETAFEIYNKCAPHRAQCLTSAHDCAPAVQLAAPIPRAIDFSLASTPIMGLSRMDRRSHVGYYWDPHRQWLSASWTDNQGFQQWNACYRIKLDRKERWPSVHEVIKEIWDTTMDLIDSNSAPWQIFVAKGGVIHRWERDGKRLKKVESSKLI